VANAGHEAAPAGLEDELEQLLLVLEVVVDEAVGDARLSRHIADRASVIAFSREHLDRRSEDGLPTVLVARFRCGAGLGSRHGSRPSLTRKSAPDPRGQHPGGQAKETQRRSQTVVAAWVANMARATPRSFSTSRLSRWRERTNSEIGRRSSSPFVPWGVGSTNSSARLTPSASAREANVSTCATRSPPSIIESNDTPIVR